MIDDNRSTDPEGIAVIGLAGRFPGAPDIDAFWRNLRDGVESVSFFTPEELLAAGVPPAMVANPAYVRAKATLDDADAFDAEFFGYLPSEVEVMDPQHRVFLECAWSALEHAGYDPRQVPNLVGVFGGMSQTTFLPLLKRLDPEGLRYNGYPVRLGTDKDYLATRVAYKLNLRGLSLTVQTACSTSLVAICQACQSLLGYQIDVALAGGVAISVPLKAGQLHQDGGIHSSDGHCRAFDARAEGIVSGEGVGIVVLKRLADAIADGDTIHAVIKGFGLSNDGYAKVGFTAPSPDGQAAAIGAALALAGFGPDTISYVEAHGTGTPLGDPIEIAGLTAAFRDGTGRTGYCAIGSVKTNIGHLDAAAGVTGLIKTVLALRHRELPPSLHFSTPNPAIDFASTPFFVNAELRPWPASSTPRRAGVSSFGLGGTNAHVVLEEAPQVRRAPETGAPQLFMLSARTQASLSRTTAAMADYLETHSDLSAADVAWTLRNGRSPFDHRTVVVGHDLAEAVEALRSADPRRLLTGRRAESAPPVAFLFPGGGAQYQNMGVELYRHEPVFREQIDRCLEILRSTCGVDLRPVLFPRADEDAAARQSIERPLNSILSVFVVEWALAQWWIAQGIRPSAMTGHSLGEYTAACLAGVFSLEDALGIVKARGDIFEKAQEGGMLSVPLSVDELRPFLRDTLSIAAINAPSLCVVSGKGADIDRLQAELGAQDIEATRLHIAVAAHSALLDPYLEEFANRLGAVRFSPPSIPFISNLSGTWATADQVSQPSYWVRHLRETVRFSAGLSTLLETPRVLLEVGPGSTLASLARMHGPAGCVNAIPSMRHPAESLSDRTVLASAVGRLWIAGLDVSWPNEPDARRRVPLPTYSFDRRRYWPSAVPSAPDVVPAARPEPAAQSAAPAQAATPAEERQAIREIEEPQRMTTAFDRPGRILQEMLRVLGELSGLEPLRLDPAATFLELGFDSLFLGRVSLAFQKTFGVRIKFRDFFEATPTPAAMAAFLDQKMPADKFAAPAAAPPAARADATAHAVASASAVTTPVVAASGPPAAAAPRPPVSTLVRSSAPQANMDAVERIVSQQLQAMLELTRQQLGAFGTAPAAAVDTGTATVPQTEPPARMALPPAAAASPVDTATNAITVFAPAVSTADTSSGWKPVAKGANGGLTPGQQRALNELVDSYGRRTARSKQLAQEIRVHLADPRAIVGFAPLWKETVYQIVLSRSLGGRVWDVDGNEWIDVTLGFGAAAYGHSPAFVIDAMRKQLELGIELGAQSELAGKVAALFCEITGHERVCFCTAGTEAVMGALRLARAYSGRDRVAMFIGDTHGRIDEVLGKPVVQNDEYSAMPAAVGISPHAVKPTLFLHYGDPKSLEIIERYADELAAVIVEPVRTRSPDLQPIDFLRKLRALTKERGVAFIMDEVVTGFRVHQGGAERLLGIEPDMSTWGKAVAAGMPIGVISGKAEYLDALDGGNWQYGDDSGPESRMTNFGGAGTFAKHPLSMAAALATLEHIKSEGPELQERTARRAERFVTTLNRHFEANGLPVHLEYFRTFWAPRLRGDRRFEPLLFVYLRNEGVHTYVDYPCFICTAHTDQDIDLLIGAFTRAVGKMRAAGFLSEPSDAPPAGGDRAGGDTTRVERVSGVPVAAGELVGSHRALAPGQQEIWLAAQLGDDVAAAFHVSSSIDLQGPLRVDALERALQAVVDRHEALRITVSPDGSVQQFHSSLTVGMPLVDLTRPSGAAPDEEAIAALVKQETSRPFDLVAGPLVRTLLVKVNDRHHRLVITAFHIVTDGWGLGIVVKDLAALYSAAVTGGTADLPDVMPYRDYLAWLDEPEQREERDRSERYWLDQFADSIPVLDLPADAPRPTLKTYKAAQQTLALDPALAASLKKAGTQHGCTTFAMVLAAFSVLLHRLSGQDDVVIGLAAAGQAAVGESNLVGHCVNLLPYRSRLPERASAAEFLKATKSGLMDAYDNQACTYGSLLTKLGVPRDAGRLPLVSALMTHELETAGTEFAGTSTRLVANPRSFCNFDLELYLIEASSGIAATFVYNADVFSAATVTRWLGHLRTLLDEIVRDASMPVRQVRLLSAADRDLILRGWNDTAVGYPGDQTLDGLFESQVARTPDEPALAFEAVTLTYRELNARANQLAHHLRAQGVGPEVMVAICAERSIELVVAMLGVVKAGGAYAPIDPHYPPERIAVLLDDLASPIVLTQQRFADRLPPGQPYLATDVANAEIAAQPTNDPDRMAGPDSAVYVIHTSGSTGRPKGVVNLHKGIVNRLRWGQDTYRIGPGDRSLQKTPFTFDVSVWEFFWPLTAGACLVVARPDGHTDPLYLARLIERQRITTLHFVPSMLDVFLDTVGREDLSSVRRVFCSGEPLGVEVQERFFRRFEAAELHNLYGPTETSIENTYWQCQRNSPLACVPIGRPIANNTIYLLDPLLQPVPIGVAGELYIGGVGVARGYLRRPDLTAERFIDDPFSQTSGARLYRSGDSARFLPDGNIEYLGRLDNQVKIRGLRIELGEIESVIREAPGVGQAAVIAREEVPGDKRLVAYLVGADADDASLTTRVKEAIARKLPDYMMPSAFVLLPALPYTSSGKLDRKALPAPQEGGSSSRVMMAPRTAVETQLIAIWADVLKVEAIGVEDDFFELGGHSLLVMRVVSRIRDAFGVELTPRAFFAHPTIARLAAAIGDSAAPADTVRVPAREQSGPGPLSFAQERLWFIEQLTPGKAAYNISDVIELEGEPNARAMSQTLAELVRRHAILRTRFFDHEGEPRQETLPALDLELAERDLSDLSPDARDREWVRFRRAEGRRTFDLTRPPLVRPTLVKLTPARHVLLLALHHIVVDEWSLELVQREVRAVYSAFRDGRPSPLPEPTLQYSDFACWQRERLTESVLAPDLEYWRKELEGAPAALELPTDRPRPASPTYRGATETFELPAELVDPLKALTQQQHATLFMTCMAAFMALLHRYTGQADIVVGTPISGRTSSETERLVGLFLNTVVMRGRFADTPSFRHLVAQVRDSAIDAYSHQDLPFERLVAELAHGRDLRYSPAFQVMFIWVDAAVTSQALQISGRQQMEIGTSKFDVTMLLSESNGRLLGTVEYSTDLFDPETIRRLIGHYRTFLESVVLAPDVPVSRAALLTDEERRQILTEWNATTVRHADGDRPLHDLLAQQAQRHPDRPAVVFEDRSISYGDLDRRSNQLAHRLRAAGAGPDVLVGVMLDRSIEMVVALHGILKSGGAYLPLDPSFPAERLAYMLADSGCDMLVTHRGLERGLPGLPRTVIRLDSETEAITALPAAPLGGVSATTAHRAYVLYTSGSTGRPKGVEVSHGALVNLLRSMQREPGFASGDIMLAVTTLSFDIAGLELHLPLLAGGTVVIAASDVVRDPAQLVRLMRESSCTVMQATPSMWRALVDAGWQGEPMLRVLCGGEPLPSELAADLLTRSAEVWNMYGPTETTIWSTCRRITDGAAIDVGRPIDNTDVLVLDAERQMVPVNVPGELWIGGAGVAGGYLGQPQLTAEKFVAHPFAQRSRMYRTGDRARWCADGTIDVLGRIDHQVKVRGFRIELGEIEGALAAHAAVREAVVVARHDGPGGASLVAYIVCRPDVEVTDAALREHLRLGLPDYMVPSLIVGLERLPLSPNGKIDRKALPAPDLSNRPRSAEAEEPQSPVEARLADIWRSVLGVARVDVTDNFFELGGHSLLAMRLVHRVHQELGVSMSPGTLFLHPVLRDLARTLVAAPPPAAAAAPIVREPVAAASGEQTLVRLEVGGTGTPFFWIHGIGGEVFSYMHLSRHLAAKRPVYGFTADWTTLSDSRPRTLENMAARYVEEMRRVQPSGPYYLGGYCAASLLALEMTRQLEQAGETVGLLVAIDYEMASPTTTRGLRTAAAFLLNLPRWVTDDALPSGGTDLMGRLLSRSRKLALARLGGAAENGGHRRLDIRDRLGMWRFPDYQRPMLELHHRLLTEYTPKPVNARLAVILPRTTPLLGPWPQGYDKTWDAVARGGVEAYHVRGSHATMMVEPHATEVAMTIERCIDRVEQERPDPPPQSDVDFAEDEETPADASALERSGMRSA